MVLLNVREVVWYDSHNGANIFAGLGLFHATVVGDNGAQVDTVVKVKDGKVFNPETKKPPVDRASPGGLSYSGFGVRPPCRHID